MVKRYKSILVGAILMLLVIGCSLPSPAPAQPLTVDEQAATIIAATLTAQPTAADGISSTATAPLTATVTFTPLGITPVAASPTITPTYSTPMLEVLEQTNCREGPGQEYQIVFTHLAGAKLEIIGRYEPNNFWLVKSPNSGTGTCWLWGEYVEVTGSYWVVPTLTPPPTATLPPPQAPSVQNWRFDCAGGNMTFELIWEDRATNETGYRIFRDGEPIAELPANSTSFTETIPVEAGESREYYLQVYGPSGTVNTSIMRLTC